MLGQLILIQRMKPSMKICGLNGGVLWVARCLFIAAICVQRWMRGFWQETLSLFLDVKPLLGIVAEALFGKNLYYCAVVHLLKNGLSQIVSYSNGDWHVFLLNKTADLIRRSQKNAVNVNFRQTFTFMNATRRKPNWILCCFLYCAIYSITGDIPLAPFLCKWIIWDIKHTGIRFLRLCFFHTLLMLQFLSHSTLSFQIDWLLIVSES